MNLSGSEHKSMINNFLGNSDIFFYVERAPAGTLGASGAYTLMSGALKDFFLNIIGSLYSRSLGHYVGILRTLGPL